MFRILIISIITFIIVIIIILLFMSFMNSLTEKFDNTDDLKKKIDDIMKQNKVWGMYFAENWSGNILPDSTGNKRDAVTSVNIKKIVKNGNGATGLITYITGGTNDNIVWPYGSIPQNFTVLSLSRYNGVNKQRILQSTGGNWLHGHWGGNAGVCFYEGWKTILVNHDANNENWICCIGNNNSNVPNNILINGNTYGIEGNGAGGGGYNLGINNPNFWGGREYSDWALACVIIWPVQLKIEEMRVFNEMINDYKKKGGSLQDYFLNTSIQTATDAQNPQPADNVVYDRKMLAYSWRTLASIDNMDIFTLPENKNTQPTEGIFYNKTEFKLLNQKDYSKELTWKIIKDNDKKYILKGNYFAIKFEKKEILKKYTFKTDDVSKAPKSWVIYGYDTNIGLKQIVSESAKNSDYDAYSNKPENTYVNFILDNDFSTNIYLIIFTDENKVNLSRIILEAGDPLSNVGATNTNDITNKTNTFAN